MNIFSSYSLKINSESCYFINHTNKLSSNSSVPWIVSQYPDGYESTRFLLSDGARSHQLIPYCRFLDAQIKEWVIWDYIVASRDDCDWLLKEHITTPVRLSWTEKRLLGSFTLLPDDKVRLAGKTHSDDACLLLFVLPKSIFQLLSASMW